MLLTLKIKNIALIDNAQIEFDSGLNVLSGETGSGKSVIIDSINFVLGGKADKSMIRSGEDECFVQAAFSVSDEINAYVEELGFEADSDGILVVSRKFNMNGKGEVRVNGQPAGTVLLKKITSALVDVHGQSEHYALMKSSAQLAAVDKFSPETEKFKSALAVPIENIKEINCRLEEIGGNPADRARMLDVLNYQISEIEEAALKEGEEEELLARKKKIVNLEKIVSAVSESLQYLSEEGGGLDAVNSAVHNISLISELDAEYGEIYRRLSDVYAELSDLSSTMSDINDGLELDSGELDALENRLDTIKSLKKKYGSDLNAVIAFYDGALKKRELLENSEALERELNEKKSRLLDKVFDIYSALSKCRREAAIGFSEKITEELVQLGMERSRFEILFAELPVRSDLEDKLSLSGADSVEFMLSPNLGEPLKPLTKIISGGELSRFMLAVKTVCDTEIGTYIFDEIDTGISGKIAKTVAEKFAAIALDKQVIAISHQPQIAAMSDSSYLIFKTEEDGKTYSRIEKLNDDGKLREITRLIGGDESSEAAVSHAGEMISVCDKYKSRILQQKRGA